jgi:hypothetical protein
MKKQTQFSAACQLEDIERYNDGPFCIYCGGDVQRDPQYVDRQGPVTIHAECGTCGKAWLEEYALRAFLDPGHYDQVEHDED